MDVIELQFGKQFKRGGCRVLPGIDGLFENPSWSSDYQGSPITGLPTQASYSTNTLAVSYIAEAFKI